MSFFVRIAKEVPDIAVDVKSALEEALEKMPNQKMSPQDVENGLKNRGVQKLEVEQAGVNRWLETDVKNGDAPNPKDILKWVKETRQDKYTVNTLKGQPVNPNGRNKFQPSKELEDDWANLSEGERLHQDEINYFIQERRDQIESVYRESDRYESEEQMNNFIKVLEDDVDVAVNIRTQLTSEENVWNAGESQEDILIRYGFSNDEVENFLVDEPFEGFVETVHRIRGPEAASQFELEMSRASSSYNKFNELQKNYLDTYARFDRRGQFKLIEELEARKQRMHIAGATTNNTSIIQMNQTIEELQRMQVPPTPHITKDQIVDQADFEALAKVASETIFEEDFTAINVARIRRKLEEANELTPERDEAVNRILEHMYERRVNTGADAIYNVDSAASTFDAKSVEFRDIVEELGDDIEATADLDDIYWYLNNIEEGVGSGRLVIGDEITQEQLNRLRDLAGEPRRTDVVTESMDLTIPTQQLVGEAKEELTRLAELTGREAPDINSRLGVEDFLNNAEGVHGQDVGDFRQSYGRLMDSVEAGEESITIPDYNTRQVQGGIRYNFDDNVHYRSYALPDTDDASYAVKLYKNPTVDTKGYTYTSHWSGDNAEDVVFHVRSDSPEPGVHRIQEIQSDIQNTMTKDRQHAVRSWRTSSFDVRKDMLRGGSVAPREDSLGQQIWQLKGDINKEYFSDLYDATGVQLDTELLGYEGYSDIASASVLDIKDALRNKITGSSSLYETPNELKLVHEGLIAGRKILDFRRLSKRTQEALREANPDLNDPQINTLIDFANNVDNEYNALIDIHWSKARDAIAEQQKMRVSYEDRLFRIQLGQMPTKEEIALRESSVKDTLEWLNTKGADIEPAVVENSHLLGDQSMIPMAVLSGKVRKAGKNLIEFAKDIAQKEGEATGQMDDISIRFMREDIEYGHLNGIELVDKWYPELEVGKFAKMGTDNATKLVKKGMKDLTPLETFPQAKDFQLPVPYIKQGFQEEVIAAIERGDREVWLTVDPDGVGKLVRGDGPQRNYDEGGKTNKQFRNIAMRFKAEVVEEDGYLKMKLPTKAALGGAGIISLSAYADTTNQDFINQAREAGVSDAEIATYLEENPIEEDEAPLWEQEAINEGVSQEQIDLYKHEQMVLEMDEADFAEHPGVKSDLPTVDGSQAYDKLPVDTIRQIAIELEVDPSTPLGMDQIYEEAMYKNNPGLREYNEEQAKQYELAGARQDIADFIELHDYWQVGTWMMAKFGYGPADVLYKAVKSDIQKAIVQTGKEHGYDLIVGIGQEIGGVTLEEDQWYVNVNGNVYDATPGFMASLGRESGEITGGVMGGIEGGIIADRMTRGWEATPYTRLMKVGVVTAGVTAGAMIGDQIDYAAAAIRQHEEFNWGVSKDKLLGSAQVAVVGEVIGYGVFKIGAAGWQALKRVYSMAANGNIEGAFDILIRSLDITEEQAYELVARWENVNQKQAPTMGDNRKWYNPRKYLSDPDKEKAIAVLPSSKAGGEHLAPAIGEKNPRAAAAIVSEINQRAKSLVIATTEQLGEGGTRGVAKDIIEAVGTYKADVEDYYKVVKQQGGELAPTGYQWDMDTMAIDELTRSLVSNIYPHQQRQAARNMLKKVDELTSSRTFEDLIELRQLMNKIRAKKSLGAKDHEAFQAIMMNIDEEIESVAGRMGPDGAQWHTDWLAARADYSQMKKLTTNALSKVLLRPGVNDQVVAKALIKYGTALDGTYDDLVKQLPLEVQPKVEALVIDNLVDKFTDGNVTQLQATNFPELSKALADYDFVWPQAKALREVVDKFAEIYQNDNALSYASGGISTTKFQSYLTTDPVVRAQFEIASGFFNQIKVLMGGPKGDAAALIKAAAKLLEDPLNPQNVQGALNAIEGDVTLEAAVRKLQSETAAQRQLGKPGGTTKIKIYEDGNGKKYTKPGEGLTDADGIPAHRMTNEEVAKKVSQADDLGNLSKVEKARLINAGFTAVGLDDGTVLLILD